MMSETIVYFKSGLGNLVQATPAMQALASLDPSGHVDVCLDPEWEKRDGRAKAAVEFLRACPFVGRLVAYRGPDPLHSRYKRGFVPLQSESSDAGHAVLRLSGQHRWPAQDWRRTLAHEAEANLEIVRKSFGYVGKFPKKFAPTDLEFPDLSGLPRPVIGLCNGAFSAPMWRKKHWPHFGSLSRLLKRYFLGTVIGIGGPKELSGVPLDLDFTGRLSVLQSARAIAQCDLFVTTDTFCMHVADALDVPQIALFGPTLCSKNAPLSRAARVIRAGVQCAPCQYLERFMSCERYACMEEIRPSDVMAQARQMLRRPGAQAGSMWAGKASMGAGIVQEVQNAAA